MPKTVAALYDDFDAARGAVEALIDAGFDLADVSLVANDAIGKEGRYPGEAGDDADDEVSAGEGAGFGAVVGAVVGLGASLIPGVGVVAGPLGAVLMTGIGAASGAVTGGVIASLIESGLPESQAQYYSEGLRRGGTLVTVHITRDEWAEYAENILSRFAPADIDERSDDWNAREWASYRETAAPVIREPMRQPEQMVGGSAPTAEAAAPATTYEPYSYYEPRFRRDYNVNYVTTGYDYTVYEPAYQYGYTLATDARYRDYDWDHLEPEAQRFWVKRYPDTWDHVRNAIRYAWREVSGQ